MTKRYTQGFTLAEMAVVVVIMAVIMGSSLKLLNTQLSNAAVQQTRDKQADIQRALLHFLRTQGRLPCPDTKYAGVAPDGLEVAPCSFAVTDGYGVVPWQTLGLGRDSAIDGWGSFISYRVANGPFFPLNTDWTSNSLLYINANTFSINEYTAPVNNVLVQERDPSAAGAPLTTVTPQAVVVLVSYGKAAWGSIKQNGTVEALSLATDEITNALIPYDTFVTRPLAVWPWGVAGGPGGGEYDDIVTHMRPIDLLGPLIQEKTVLGSCQSYCAAPGPGCAYLGVPFGQASGVCP